MASLHYICFAKRLSYDVDLKRVGLEATKLCRSKSKLITAATLSTASRNLVNSSRSFNTNNEDWSGQNETPRWNWKASAKKAALALAFAGTIGESLRLESSRTPFRSK